MEKLIEIFLEQAEITEENYNKEIFETKFLIFIDDFSKKIISNLNENVDELVTYEKDKNENFQLNNNKRWKDLFSTYEVLLSCSLDMMKLWRSKNDTSENILTSTLLRLHAKGYLIAKEILYLCQGGYADGALARWRSLHEITCFSLFILKYGDECAERFIHHSIIDEIKHFQHHNKHKDRLKVEAVYAQDEHEKLAAFLEEKYGKYFDKPYAWANKFLTDKPKETINFSRIEEHVSLDHYRFFYSQASQGIHGAFLHLIDNLGIRECKEDVLLVGQSDSGMALPISSASISLSIITTQILSINSQIEDVVSIKVIEYYRQKIEEIIVQTK